MSDEKEADRPPRVYAPIEQQILPAFGKEISRPKKDYRPWRNERGEQIDSPKYRGQQFTGKIIPPLTDSGGNPIKLGVFQIVKDARGSYNVIDWSQPVDSESASSMTPIMGKVVFRTRMSLDYAKTAMRIKHREHEDNLAGLPFDPVQCKDADGQEVFRGRLVLAKHARGKFTGMFTIIDTGCDIASSKRRTILRAKTQKEAVKALEAAAKEAPRPLKKEVFVGAPIAFDVPVGFGGGFGQERESPTYEDASWKAIVTIFAKTGKWCRSADLIWPSGEFPAEITEQAKNYREEYLANPASFYDV